MASYGGTVAAPTLGFRDSTGTLIDPGVVTLKFKDPTGAVTSYTYGGGQIIRDGTGLYHYDVDTSGKAGIWTYEWLTPSQTLQSNSFQVLADPI
jgi:hypothetical protein